jgi:hypothetical protein
MLLALLLLALLLLALLSLASLRRGVSACRFRLLRRQSFAGAVQRDLEHGRARIIAAPSGGTR